ncbi:fluoroquinolone transport system permease protein [Paenibacillus sp. DS2015]|uniref:fluoroquinolone export ABC transporter permease subunit n=1 Tax=Paenibacillus sp. DS2015 TaxID=3373917 RepID=UPI003D1ECC6E
MRAMNAVLNDIRFQWRHGLYWVYMLVCVLYLLLIHFIPAEHKETVTMLLTFSDPSALGLILAGGIVLLEKDQGIHDSLFVTPLRLLEYLLAKAISLSLLSLTAAWVIHIFSLGVPVAPIRFSLGVFLTSVLFSLLSIGIVVRTRSINGFILLSQLYSLPFVIPLFGFFGIGRKELYFLFPTEGSLLLLQSSYRYVSLWETVYALVILLLASVGVFYWAYRSFQQKILLKIGDGD